MIRQRVHLRTPALAYLVRALTVALALILIWYGAMVVLLAVKVSPHTVNSISGYRTLYSDASGLRPSDFTTVVSLIVGFGGIILFALMVYLALHELPRPYLARGDVTLRDEQQGRVTVEPRAVERLAELAAGASDEVTGVSGRLADDELNVHLRVRRAAIVAQTLRDARDRVTRELVRHELPPIPVNVTLTGYDPKTRRELS